MSKYPESRVSTMGEGRALAAEMPAGGAPERVSMDRPGHFFVLGGPQEFFFRDEGNGQMQVVRFVTPMADILWKRAVTKPTGH